MSCTQICLRARLPVQLCCVTCLACLFAHGPAHLLDLPLVTQTDGLQARGIPAVACCHVQHQAYAPLSKAHLLQLSGHVDSILKSSRKTGIAECLQLQQAATLAAAELQVTDAPRVYV